MERDEYRGFVVEDDGATITITIEGLDEPAVLLGEHAAQWREVVAVSGRSPARFAHFLIDAGLAVWRRDGPIPKVAPPPEPAGAALEDLELHAEQVAGYQEALEEAARRRAAMSNALKDEFCRREAARRPYRRARQLRDHAGGGSGDARDRT